jgi:hypothetical protein
MKDIDASLESYSLYDEKWRTSFLVSGYLMLIVALYLFHITIALLEKYLFLTNITHPDITKLAIKIFGTPTSLLILVLLITMFILVSKRYLEKNEKLFPLLILIFFSQSIMLLVLSIVIAGIMTAWIPTLPL